MFFLLLLCSESSKCCCNVDQVLVFVVEGVQSFLMCKMIHFSMVFEFLGKDKFCYLTSK